MRQRRGRITLREKMERNLAALKMQSRTGSNAFIEKFEEQLAALPPKRHRIKRPVDGKPVVPLEKHVLADVLQALRRDPRVALVERSQSGLFQDGDRYIRVGTPGKLDITLMLVGGRYAEIEVKRPGGKPEPHQQNRIDAIRRNGGIAGCATSAEEALGLLPLLIRE